MSSQESAVTSSNIIDSEPVAVPPRRSHIHFPSGDTTTLRQIHRTGDSSFKDSLIARTAPSRQSSPLNPNVTATAPPRRIRSIASKEVSPDPSPSGRRHIASIRSNHRLDSQSLGDTEDDNFGLIDEYDLSHEDPRILQDVHSALKLKARREARLSRKSTVSRSETASIPPQTIVAALQPVSPASIRVSRQGSLGSDVDFSPSTASIHPLPTSLDNGSTLDWSGHDDRAEGRWRLSGSKRKGKEITSPVKAVLEQQEVVFSDKVARLKAIASPQTWRKAKLIQDQFTRRYSVTYSILAEGATHNPVEVVRWYSKQDILFRHSIEKVEPFLWLKHLDKRSAKQPERSPWNLSALITEEYLRTQLHQDADSHLRDSFTNISTPSSHLNAHRDPLAPHTSPYHVYGSPFSKKLPVQEELALERGVNSQQISLEFDSRQSPTSSFSSLPTGFPVSNSSPEEYGQHSREPETREHLSNQPDQLDHQFGQSKPQASSVVTPGTDIKIILSSDDLSDEDIPRTHVTASSLASALPDNAKSTQSPVNRPTDYQIHATVDLTLKRRRVPRSLPPADRITELDENREHEQQEANEEKYYEMKTRLLEEASAANNRVRQLLNRVSSGIREYEIVQSNSMASLGIKYVKLPHELIDAFGHDPAAVTGSTRRFQGWRAVDDIQNRLIRQREVFQSFLSGTSHGALDSKNVLDDPISSLIRSLEALEIQSHMITKYADEVGSTLKGVQETHDRVKADYNQTLSRTSVVYPELSNIIALEESYKDQYQLIWEFGMDTLTFLLDTVTPFWRSYGKPIGRDIRDFLIIPLYRNEFTGEFKRYPILRIPARSFRHWLALLIFFCLSVIVNVLQARAAVSSSVHYRLSMIPYDGIRWTALPFFWTGIMIQWWAVVVESIVVFLQVGVVIWWVGWSVRIFT